jgi:hypothetical protein
MNLKFFLNEKTYMNDVEKTQVRRSAKIYFGICLILLHIVAPANDN